MPAADVGRNQGTIIPYCTHNFISKAKGYSQNHHSPGHPHHHMLGALLSSLPQWLVPAPAPFVNPTMDDIISPHTGIAPFPVNGLELTHCVLSRDIFSLNASASRLSTQEVKHVSLQASSRQIPHFLPHTDAESVEMSWRAAMAASHPARLPFAAQSDVFGSISVEVTQPVWDADSMWPDYRQIPYNRSDPEQWQVSAVMAPNVSDKATVVALAKMAANAYVPIPHEGDWSDVNGTREGWLHQGDGFGWDDDQLRGYVFTSNDNKTMVISIKGTSAAVLDDGGPTAPSDKINDNLLFSCCCARVSRSWTTCCDCYIGKKQCDEVCLERALFARDKYYRQSLQIYENARRLVPTAENVWVTGHSLGGALAGLLARTYGLPAVTFEAPGEELARQRLHLPAPPGIAPWDDHVWHFGHTADPIYIGSCKGYGSSCALTGYAMETQCHSGLLCIYDTREDFGWHESIVNHKIHVVIDSVLEKYDEPAICLASGPCTDCENWEFLDTLDTDPAPTSSSASPSVPVTSSASTLASIPPVTPTSSRATSSAPRSTPTGGQSTTYCVTRDWKWKCQEWTTEPVSSSTSLSTSPTSTPSTASATATASTCVHSNFLGWCDKWEQR